ncbi:MAG: hypothetical protein HOV86_06020 [Thermoactinospora sp.]|nr:hypothetical protein [Thermoactinospora sp.]
MTIRLPAGPDRQRARLHQTLADHRLVTLTGPGGIGKSALAAAVAATHPGAVVLDLAAARARNPVPNGLPDADLLVLDTCEHLLAALTPHLAAHLARHPGRRILLTSRHIRADAGHAPIRNRTALSLPTGRVLTVPPLTTTQADALHRRLSGGRTLNPAVLARLDGLPLAVRIAAAHRLDSAALSARLDDGSFYALPAPSRHPERHTTLRASAAWSLALCTDADRRAWALLATLPAPFTLGQAERLLGGRAPVSRLAERSLLIGDGFSHRLPEYLRRFVLEQPTAFTM